MAGILEDFGIWNAYWSLPNAPDTTGVKAYLIKKNCDRSRSFHTRYMWRATRYVCPDTRVWSLEHVGDTTDNAADTTDNAVDTDGDRPPHAPGKSTVLLALLLQKCEY